MQKRFIRSKFLAAGAAALLAVGIVGGTTVAFADTPPAGDAAPPHAGPGKPGPAGFGLAMGIQDLIKSTGVTRDELKQGSDAGLTLGQIIEQYGDKPADQAKTDALALLQSRLDQMVAGGHLTAEREADMLAKAGDAIDKLLASKPGDHTGKGPFGGPRGHAIVKNALDTVADVLGTDVKSIVEDLRSGKTIAQIAGDKTPAVSDALTAQANAAIQKLLDEGKIDETEAAKLRDNVAKHVDGFINNPHPGPVGHGKPGAAPNGRTFPPKPAATPTQAN